MAEPLISASVHFTRGEEKMNFIQNLFGGKDSKTFSTSKNSLSGEDMVISGTQAASVVKKLLLQARQEKWNPTYSIKLICTNCEAPVTLKKTSVTEFSFLSAKGSYRPEGLEDSLKCEKCEGTSFRLLVHPKTLSECLKEALSELTLTDQNPEVGFREDRTGNLIQDRTLRKVSGFESLWSRIQSVVDQEDQINTRFTFDMVNGRYLEKTIHGLLLYNCENEKTIIILKDQNGCYWYSIEP